MKKIKGFTLLELLVVLFVVATLLVLVSVKLGDRLDDAREMRIDTDMAQLIGAGERYAQAQPKQPLEGQEALVAAGFLEREIESPVDGYAYKVVIDEGKVWVALMKGEVVYEAGSYHAERTSTRLYLD